MRGKLLRFDFEVLTFAHALPLGPQAGGVSKIFCMKLAFVLLAAAALAVSLEAQEPTPTPTPKPARKRLFFLPGAKAPEPTPAPATPSPSPKPAAKTTPKSSPKPTAKPASKPAPKSDSVEKTDARPAENAPAPPVAKIESAPAEKPAASSPAKIESKSAEKPAASPPAKTETRPAEIIVTKSAASPVSIAPDRIASPAVVTSTVPPAPAQIVRAFFNQLGKGDIDGAYASLMKGSRIGEHPEEVRALKSKTKEAIDLFGVVHGYDLVDNKPVGERLMRATYLSLGHELPLRWRFYFYKAEEEWKLIDLRVDDKLTGIFDESPEDNPRPSETRP